MGDGRQGSLLTPAIRALKAGRSSAGQWLAEIGETIRAPFASVSFRLALNYGIFSILTMLVLITVFYVQTVGVIRQANIRQITVTAQRLQAIHDREGSEGLAIAISQAVTDGIDTDTEVLMLLSPVGSIEAGNLLVVPEVVLHAPRQSVEAPILHNQRSARGQLLVTPLPDGSQLIVGREMSEQLRFSNLVKDATMAAAAITLLLVLGGAFWFREALERRVELIRQTTRRIGTGDLTQRVPLTGEADEFARLDDDINQMLDRIEALMHGVRHVSNTIAHEMRTPITRALSRLRTAEAAGADLEELRKVNRTVMRELEFQAQLLDKLLQIAEAESGTRRQAFQTTDIAEIAADVVDLFDSLADERGVRLSYAGNPVPSVEADRDLVAGCISNLVINAINHAGQSARVMVSTGYHEGTVALVVEDNGPGVPADALARLGQRFYRVNPDVAGVGLGLATVRAIVQLHGGEIDFEDVAPGLRVRLTFPLPSN